MNSKILINSLRKTEINSISTYPTSKFINVTELINILSKNRETFVVQVCKKTPYIFNKSLWVGHRMGGMSSWLSTCMYQLPYKNFYLYVDNSEIPDRETLEYYDTFYKRAFYKNYLGLCTGNRNEIPEQHLHEIRAITANNLLQTIESFPQTILVDVRTPQQIKKIPVSSLPKQVRYCNIPLGDEDLNEKVAEVFHNYNGSSQIITMCAKGYRGTIAYTLFRHLIKSKNKNMYVCQSSVEQINKALEEQTKPNQTQNRIF